jgi:hypothetical protein
MFDYTQSIEMWLWDRMNQPFEGLKYFSTQCSLITERALIFLEGS